MPPDSPQIDAAHTSAALADSPLKNALQAWMEIFMRHSMREFVRFAKERELSLSQLGALFHLHSQAGCGVSDLGDRLGISSAAVSQMLDRLVQQGMIERNEARHDRRFKQILLMEKGRQVLHESMRARTIWLDELAAALTAEEQEQVLAVLNILIEKADLLEKAETLDRPPRLKP